MKAKLSWADLMVFGMGITPEELRGGSKYRRTRERWPLAKAHQDELAGWLEGQGLDPLRQAYAQEVVDGDYFVITQD
jgi:hypothetical protein